MICPMDPIWPVERFWEPLFNVWRKCNEVFYCYRQSAIWGRLYPSKYHGRIDIGREWVGVLQSTVKGKLEECAPPTDLDFGSKKWDLNSARGIRLELACSQCSRTKNLTQDATINLVWGGSTALRLPSTNDVTTASCQRRADCVS